MDFGRRFDRYIDAGDVASASFSTGDLTLDGEWHELDLSNFIPVGTKRVRLHAILKSDNVVGTLFEMRHYAYNNWPNSAPERVAVADVSQYKFCEISVDSLRKIAYAAWNEGTWTYVYLTVVGWWI